MNRSILGVSLLLAAARAKEPVNKNGDGVSGPTSAVTPNTLAQAAPSTLEGLASGRVTTLPGTPVPGADVTFSSPDAFATRTDDNGFFVQAPLAAGSSIEMVISAAEYTPATVTVTPEKRAFSHFVMSKRFLLLCSRPVRPERSEAEARDTARGRPFDIGAMRLRLG